MSGKKNLGFLLIIVGVVMLFGSQYINNQVLEGRTKINNAQNAVDKSTSLFNLNPVSKQVGQGLTGRAQKKIDAGSAEAAHYEMMAKCLQVGGIIAIIAGVGLVVIGWKKG